MCALEFERGLGLGSGSLADLKEVINSLSLEHVEGRCHQTPVPVDGDIFKITPSRQVKKCLACVDPHIKQDAEDIHSVTAGLAESAFAAKAVRSRSQSHLDRELAFSLLHQLAVVCRITLFPSPAFCTQVRA